MTRSTPVLLVGALFPEQASRSLTLPEGLTLLQMIERAFPGIAPAELEGLRVTLVTRAGIAVIAPRWWRVTRPRPGVQVVIRRVAGRDALRSVLSVLITVAAISIGQFYVGSFLGAAGLSATGGALLSAGISLVGNLLLNALIPVRRPASDNANPSYTISAFRNTARPGDPVPLVLGRHRYAPPFAATSFTEVVGNDQYVRALFCLGYGPLNIDDIRIGDTPIGNYSDIEVETREGRPGDLPVTLYPRQVLEESAGVDLVRPLPRDAAGNVIAGAATETPVTRFTAYDSAQASVIVGFPAGLFAVDSKGRTNALSVDIRIRQRAEGAEDWSAVTTLSITAAERNVIFRQYTWDLPSRGRWEIEVTRMTDERTSTTVSDRTNLSAIQSIRPEYPIAMTKPLALIAMRIRATYQLNGALDNVNAIVQRYATTWSGTAWAEALSRNPATAYLAALQGPANPYPVADSEIDWDGLADWSAWCDAKGLKYDAVHDQANQSLGDMLTAICAAGRATPRHDGLTWGVVIDRPQSQVIDHINARNAADFKGNRSYFDPPDAFRVTFLDETNGWASAERIVPWPGHTGPIDLTEDLPLPGKTDPAEVWIEARRRMYELLNRPDAITVTQDGAARVATRGDLVMGSWRALVRTQVAARVTRTVGRLVEIDELVTIEAGKSYGIRFRVYADDADTVGTSVVREVTGSVGESRLLRFTTDDALPLEGSLVHVGELAAESIALRVKGIEPGEGLSSVLHLVAAAPEIDDLTDAEVPPAWNGRVGAEVDLSALAPAIPAFTGISTGLAGTGDANGLAILIAPGTGGAAATNAFRVEHRLASGSSWTTVTIPAASGGLSITGYVAGDSVALRAVAIAADDTESAYTATVTVTIGADDPAIPAALDASAISVIGGLGAAQATIGLTSDPDTAQLQFYRVASGGTLDRSTDAVGAPVGVAPSTTVTWVDGDGTRANLLTDAGFDNPASWTAAAGWTVGGVATHTPGTADTIRQPVALTSGKYYRLSIAVGGRTAGSLTPTLFDGSDRPGLAITADGLARDRIQAVTGNDAFGFAASSDFDGEIDQAVLFLETAACIPAGDWDYYVEPQNLEGVPGPISGPFSVTII